MRDEPQLVDIFAMFAMYSFLQTAPKNARSNEIAYEAYEQAEAMMHERNLRNSEGKRDDR
jgi:hypothetical protein